MKRLHALGTAAAALTGLALWKRRPTYDLHGRVVVITGGSRGLGLVLARQIAALGGRVVLLARDAEELARAKEDLSRRGLEVLTGLCDVRSQAEVAAATAEVQARRFLDLGAGTGATTLSVLARHPGAVASGPCKWDVHSRARHAPHSGHRVPTGPFRWCALSGDPADIRKTDAMVKELLPDDRHLHHWLDMAAERVAFQWLPARICWVGLGDRHRLGLAFNDMVARGELAAPVVIGRDHLDSGSVASPNRETEAMADGSDAVSDWPLLNALLNCASGATWVSIHHGGGVGMGYSQHAGVVVVCDGTSAAARRIERVLWNDPATGVMRHADAGYPDAIETARTFSQWAPGDACLLLAVCEGPAALVQVVLESIAGALTSYLRT